MKLEELSIADLVALRELAIKLEKFEGANKLYDYGKLFDAVSLELATRIALLDF